MKNYKKQYQKYALLFVRESLANWSPNSEEENEIYIGFDWFRVDPVILEAFPQIDSEALIVINNANIRNIEICGNECNIFFTESDAPFILPMHAINRFIVPCADIDLTFDSLDHEVLSRKAGIILNFPGLRT